MSPIVSGGSGSGGSQPDYPNLLARYDSPAEDWVAVPSGTFTQLPWELEQGAAFFNLTDPTWPIIVTSGVYSFLLFLSTDIDHPGVSATINLSENTEGLGGGSEWTWQGIMPLYSIPGATGCASAVIPSKYCATGEKLFVAVTQASGSPVNIFGQLYIQRLT